MNTMLYRGHIAQIEYSSDDGCFIGHVAGINDVVGFHGESVAELRAAFEEAVDDYLQTCGKLNRLPQAKVLLLHHPRSPVGEKLRNSIPMGRSAVVYLRRRSDTKRHAPALPTSSPSCRAASDYSCPTEARGN